MKYVLVVIVAASSCAFAQDGVKTNVFYQSGVVKLAASKPGMTIQGAPYSAAITNESIQTLADGNRIVQTSTGTTARDSQGRTRQDAALPAIGNLSATNAPHLVFIQDPVAKVSYTLNLTDKTAQKIPMPSGAGAGAVAGAAGGSGVFFVQTGKAGTMDGPLPPPGMAMQKILVADEQAQVSTEDLGSQTMEGVLVNGVRTTRTIPAGEIGNDRPIGIVTEVWTSPDLKTVVSSKRSDPRMGEQTFQLTNIVRAEPDPFLFSVPADFKIVEGPQKIIYRTKQ
jgi:hypothetical protein